MISIAFYKISLTLNCIFVLLSKKSINVFFYPHNNMVVKKFIIIILKNAKIHLKNYLRSLKITKNSQKFTFYFGN